MTYNPIIALLIFLGGGLLIFAFFRPVKGWYWLLKNNYQSNEIHVEQKVMKVHYLTCNERCAKRYINRVKDSKITDKWQCLHLLKELVQNLKGIRVNEIEEGLDKGIQMQYCGPNGVSVQKFREMNSSEGKYEKI